MAIKVYLITTLNFQLAVQTELFQNAPHQLSIFHPPISMIYLFRNLVEKSWMVDPALSPYPT